MHIEIGMTKSWKKIGEGNYTLLADGLQAATMLLSIHTSEGRAAIKTGDADYVLRRTGFWKTTLLLENTTGGQMARMAYDKWYANSYKLEYGGSIYSVVIRNNPLAEWAILHDGGLLLAYGLSTENGKTSLRITQAARTQDLLLDCILWYLFVPIATENCGDQFLFSLLLLGQ
jgi:hypothetical protein